VRNPNEGGKAEEGSRFAGKSGENPNAGKKGAKAKEGQRFVGKCGGDRRICTNVAKATEGWLSAERSGAGLRGREKGADPEEGCRTSSWNDS
jgi:hypothetical protein